MTTSKLKLFIFYRVNLKASPEKTVEKYVTCSSMLVEYARTSVAKPRLNEEMTGPSFESTKLENIITNVSKNSCLFVLGFTRGARKYKIAVQNNSRCVLHIRVGTTTALL